MLTDVLEYLVNFTKKKNYNSSEIKMLIAAGNEYFIICDAIFYVQV